MVENKTLEHNFPGSCHC